jgi:hypothetical protein
VIAAAVGLLVVALVLLLVGIIKSMVGPLVLSLFATVGACGLLSASWAYYRRAVAPAASDDGHANLAPAGNGDRPPGAVPTNWDALAADDATRRRAG